MEPKGRSERRAEAARQRRRRRFGRHCRHRSLLRRGRGRSPAPSIRVRIARPPPSPPKPAARATRPRRRRSSRGPSPRRADQAGGAAPDVPRARPAPAGAAYPELYVRPPTSGRKMPGSRSMGIEPSRSAGSTTRGSAARRCRAPGRADPSTTLTGASIPPVFRPAGVAGPRVGGRPQPRGRAPVD